jgi:hypothetical protein
MNMCRQLGFRTESNVNMVQKGLGPLAGMPFGEVRRNRRSTPLHLRHDAEPFGWRQQLGETVAVDDQFDSLSPYGQFAKTLHVKRAHFSPPGKKLDAISPTGTQILKPRGVSQ